MLEGLYEVMSKDENGAVVKLSDENHPIFKAHFPTQPILPGFIHFEIVSNIFELPMTAIKKAKFSNLVSPKQILRYERNGNKFRVFCEEKEMVSFAL